MAAKLQNHDRAMRHSTHTVKEDAHSPFVPGVSVVTCAYSEGRWDDLVAAVDSIRRQTVPALETILVIDHNDRLLDRARSHFPDVRVEPNVRSRGASGARNTGGSLHGARSSRSSTMTRGPPRHGSRSSSGRSTTRRL